MKPQDADPTSSESKTRVLIADDHSVVLEGIERVLQKEPDFQIVGVAGDGRQALNQIKSLHPDIVVMDIAMPDFNGIEAAQEIRSYDAGIDLVVFTMYADKEYVIALFKAGARGYVLKGQPMEELVMALKAVKEGGTYYTQEVWKTVQEHMQELELGEAAKDVRDVKDGLARLSVREKEVFVLLADGLRPKDIAKRLSISPKTVESHKYNIMEKLGVVSVAQLTKIALRKDLIEL